MAFWNFSIAMSSFNDLKQKIDIHNMHTKQIRDMNIPELGCIRLITNDKKLMSANNPAIPKTIFFFK
jgi:hypothetical protein